MANQHSSLLLPFAALDDPEDYDTTNGSLYQRVQHYFTVVAASPRMSPRDREVLNPCEKLRRYGRIPWKLTIHCSLAIMTSIMVYVWTCNDALHIRHSLMHFRRSFLGIPSSETRVEIASSVELRDKINGAVGAFFDIHNFNLTDYSLCEGPLEMDVFLGNGDSSHLLLHSDTWKSDPAYRHAISEITSDIRLISIRGVVHDTFNGKYWHQCFRWTVDVNFDHGGTGMVLGGLEYKLTECSKDGSTNLIIPIIVICLSLISISLCMKAFMKQRDKRGWFSFNVAGNLMQMIASLGCMRLVRRMDIDHRFVLIGLSAIMAWISLLRYLRYFHIYYVLVSTLVHAVPQCIRFVTGVAPILVGYALLGNCLFYQSPMFTTIGSSIATLFSLLNGDIIRDSFTEMERLMPFWGQLYLYSFLCLFIYVVLHIFISIVEESYFSAREHQKRIAGGGNSRESSSPVDPEELVLVSSNEGRSNNNLEQYILSRVKEDIAAIRRSSSSWTTAKLQIETYLN